ncbi:MAG: hypothetical protein GQ578_11125 [Desulfuromonadaceae bacterium]|nr:hypothetical protein [Desulfuromonadaceae bacterium]
MGYLQSIFRDSKPLQGGRMRFTNAAHQKTDSRPDYQPPSYQSSESVAQSEPMGKVKTSVTPSVTREHPLPDIETAGPAQKSVPVESIADPETTSQSRYTTYEMQIQTSSNLPRPLSINPNTPLQAKCVMKKAGQQIPEQTHSINVENDADKLTTTQAPDKSGETILSRPQTNTERTEVPYRSVEQGPVEMSRDINTVGEGDEEQEQQSSAPAHEALHEDDAQSTPPHTFRQFESEERSATVITSHVVDESQRQGSSAAAVQQQAHTQTPQVHIGQIDITVTAPEPQPRTQPASGPAGNDLVSRLYLRGL